MNNVEVNEKKLWAEDRKKHDLKYPDESVVRFLKKNFKSGENKSILDFGCGSGRNTLVMADMGFMIYAMDYNEVCLELTKEKLDNINYSNVRYLQNEKLKINLPDESLDCIVAWGALVFFNKSQREIFYKELNRVLKPGGIILADYRSKEDSLYKRGEQIEEDLFKLEDTMTGNLDGFIYWFCDKEYLIELYEKSGFEIFNTEKKEFSADNLKIKNSHYHVWGKKR